MWTAVAKRIYIYIERERPPALADTLPNLHFLFVLEPLCALWGHKITHFKNNIKINVYRLGQTHIFMYGVYCQCVASDVY